MPLKRIYILIFILGTLIGQAQDVELSPLSKISVLTAGSGSELYSSFGHSAVHVEDPSMDIDAIYNYGTFDFTTPNFYTKFARGKLNYTLSRQRYPYFLMGYEQEERWVKQQVLDLSLDERQALFEFLETNYLPGNRDYKYDFFYNNCTTSVSAVIRLVPSCALPNCFITYSGKNICSFGVAISSMTDPKARSMPKPDQEFFGTF